MRFFLLLALLGLSAAPAAPAQTPFQRLARYRYYEADPDSMSKVLATQHTDSARLRTLLHLSQWGANQALFAELVVLTKRLRRPEYRAYRLLLAGLELNERKAIAPALDSLQA